MCLAIPGQVVSIEQSNGMRMGRVQFGGIVRQASLEFVPEAQIGDYVLVHVGFALSTVDESEARQVFEYLKQMGGLAELEQA